MKNGFLHGPGYDPGGQKMLLGLIHLLEAHIVHDRHEMQIDSGNGVLLRTHGQGSLHDAKALCVFFLEVEVMGLDIE